MRKILSSTKNMESNLGKKSSKMKLKNNFVFLILALSFTACHQSGDAFYIYNSQERDFYINGEVLKPQNCRRLVQPPSSISLSEGEEIENIVCSNKPNNIPCIMNQMGYYTIRPRLILAIYKLGGEKYGLESIPSGDTTCPPPKQQGFFN